MGLFIPPAELVSQIAKLKKQGPLVFTNGCFDLLHVGHIRYLQSARNLGSSLVVGINTDASVRALKGPTRPVQNENDRAEILAALESVSLTLLFSEETPEKLIHSVRPDILVKGGDWKVEQISGGSFVQSYGGKVMSLQFVASKSTTSIIEKSRA